jgi:hypothetical protein
MQGSAFGESSEDFLGAFTTFYNWKYTSPASSSDAVWYEMTSYTGTDYEVGWCKNKCLGSGTCKGFFYIIKDHSSGTPKG